MQEPPRPPKLADLPVGTFVYRQEPLAGITGAALRLTQPLVLKVLHVESKSHFAAAAAMLPALRMSSPLRSTSGLAE